MRIVYRWNTPERALLKCVAIRLYDKGLRGKALTSACDKLVPHWKKYFDGPITDNALAARASRARSVGYENEAPEDHPLLSQYWATAGKEVAKGKKLSREEVARLVQQKARPSRKR